MLRTILSVRMVVAFAPSMVVMVWLLSKLTWFWQHDPDLRFGWLLLILIGYVLWEDSAKWSACKGAETATAPRGDIGLSGIVRKCTQLMIAAVGCCLLFLFQIYQTAFGLNAAGMFGLGLGALCIVTANAFHVLGAVGARCIALAMALLFLAFPMPSTVHHIVVGGLQSAVATVTVEVLAGLGIPAEPSGTIIRLGNGTVGVDEACSGIRSLQSSLMIAWFVGHVVLGTRMGKALLIAIAIGGAVVGNLTRSILLAWCVHLKGNAAAAEWHDTAGWTVLVCTLATVAISVGLVARLERGIALAPVGPTLAREG